MPMASTNVAPASFPARPGYLTRRFWRILPVSPLVRFVFPAHHRVAAAASSAIIQTPAEPISAEKVVDSRADVLACPICYNQVTWSGNSSLSLESVRGTSLQCNTCKKSYYANEAHFDLTVASGAKDYVESKPLSTEFFSTPIMGFLYERGWRQNFGYGGFPGADKEFEMAKDYLRPVLGGTIIDASCGSGLFSRRFAKSRLFSLVVALDYSEAMLKQCVEFIKEEEQGFPKDVLTLVRADIARLPFVSGSIDAVHAGAAIHCWPSPSTAVAEISRVLKPGGVFVATTTLADGLFTLIPFLHYFRESMVQVSGGRLFLSERELEDLCRSCGLVDFTCLRNGLFIMISARKPT
ncbi:hypothetical protein V2J09_002937 [Rumex salicifolius]